MSFSDCLEAICVARVVPVIVMRCHPKGIDLFILAITYVLAVRRLSAIIAHVGSDPLKNNMPL
jgi:hypothetical protein